MWNNALALFGTFTRMHRCARTTPDGMSTAQLVREDRDTVAPDTPSWEGGPLPSKIGDTELLYTNERSICNECRRKELRRGMPYCARCLSLCAVEVPTMHLAAIYDEAVHGPHVTPIFTELVREKGASKHASDDRDVIVTTEAIDDVAPSRAQSPRETANLLARIGGLTGDDAQQKMEEVIRRNMPADQLQTADVPLMATVGLRKIRNLVAPQTTAKYRDIVRKARKMTVRIKEWFEDVDPFPKREELRGGGFVWFYMRSLAYEFADQSHDGTDILWELDARNCEVLFLAVGEMAAVASGTSESILYCEAQRIVQENPKLQESKDFREVQRALFEQGFNSTAWIEAVYHGDNEAAEKTWTEASTKVTDELLRQHVFFGGEGLEWMTAMVNWLAPKIRVHRIEFLEDK